MEAIATRNKKSVLKKELLVTKSIATRSKKLLVAPGLTTILVGARTLLVSSKKHEKRFTNKENTSREGERNPIDPKGVRRFFLSTREDEFVPGSILDFVGPRTRL